MGRTLAAKGVFANGAQRFVERAWPRGRWAALTAAIALVVSFAAPFGTGAIPAAPRTGFWLTLTLLNFALWELWFTWFGRRGWHWRRTMLLGLPVMLLPLPLEVGLGLRLFGGGAAADPFGIWWRGLAIAAVLMLVMLLVNRTAAPVSADPRFPDTAIRLDRIAALKAEDHYVRLYLSDGSDRLVYKRFADAVAAMEPISGERLGRGAWLADRFRGAARCRNRRWFIHGGGECWLPVSRSRIAALREKGWLAREG